MQRAQAEPAAKPANLVTLMGQGPGFDSPQNSACSVSSQTHGVLIIVTTGCWANKGEGGTGDTQINESLRNAQDSATAETEMVQRTGECLEVELAFSPKLEINAPYGYYDASSGNGLGLPAP